MRLRLRLVVYLMGSSTNLHLEKEHSACRDPGNLSYCPTGEKKGGGNIQSGQSEVKRQWLLEHMDGVTLTKTQREKLYARSLDCMIIISLEKISSSHHQHAKMYFEFKNFDFLLVTLTEDWSDGWLKPLKDFHLLLLFHSLLSLLSVNSNSLDGWVIDSSACIWKIAFQLDSVQNQLFFRKFVSFFQGCDSHAREKKRVWVRVCVCACAYKWVCVCMCVLERS